MKDIKNTLHNKLFLMTVINILFYFISLAAIVFMNYSTVSFAAVLLLFLICQIVLLYYFSPGFSSLWQQIIDHKLLTCTLLLVLARTGLTVLHCFTRSSGSPYARMGMILSLLLFYGTSVFYFLSREKKVAFDRLFLVQAFIFGTVLNMIFPHIPSRMNPSICARHIACQILSWVSKARKTAF